VGNTTDVLVPDIGDFSDVEVIEVAVSPGDRVAAEDPLITLESDKAAMDVPSSHAGTVKEVKVSVGDRVSEGDAIVTLEEEGGDADDGQEEDSKSREKAAAEAAPEEDRDDGDGSGDREQRGGADDGQGEILEITVPDIGDFSDVPIIEVAVSEGDRVDVEDPLVTLESDKAAMDVPSTHAGTVKELRVKQGDTVSEGDVILTLESSGDGAADEGAKQEQKEKKKDEKAEKASKKDRDQGASEEGKKKPDKRDERAREQRPPPTDGAGERRPSPTAELGEARSGDRPPHASPAIRRFARELGVDLRRVKGTGRKGRILKDDVKRFIKEAMERPAAAAAPAAGGALPEMPAVDFSRFGDTETRPLSRIKKLSGPHLHRAWLHVPHVTHHDEADITELEAFRQSLKEEAGKRNVRVTLLVFVMKAVAAALREFPDFNASLAPDGEHLILKKYYNVGIAVDTPHGLVVPVFREVDRKSVFELAAEMGEVSARARDGKLKPGEMQGGCISISSLGGIGGTAFTPIVNAPEVAILGLTRSRMMPVWNGEEFVPRLMQPLDLSYDHRVIDGAGAARFTAYLAATLADVRRLLL